jgi:hypothetical protein
VFSSVLTVAGWALPDASLHHVARSRPVFQDGPSTQTVGP